MIEVKIMSIRDENYEWKKESSECSKEIREKLIPIFDKYIDEFSFEDLYYLICTEVSSIITRECGLRSIEARKSTT